MIPRLLPLSLFIVVLAPGLLHAQTASNNQQTIQLFKFREIMNDKMYEDIEIFRRILGRELQPLYPRVSYPNVTSNPFTSTAKPVNSTAYDLGGFFYLQEPNAYILASPPDKQESLSSLEGVYLKGQGIVYTATLSSLQPSAKSATAGSVTRRVEAVLKDSEWESVRRQVRNEKEKPKKPEVSKPPKLSDVLLNILAENGHNFSQLGENESLTLVLTVHDRSASSSAPKSGTGSVKPEPKAATSYSLSVARQQLRDLEHLGELHLKHGKSAEAIAVFTRLLAEVENNPKQAAEVRRKMAQCYLMEGQDEKARVELEQAIALMKKDAEAKDKPLSAVKPATALPVKLIISAPKKMLDQVKEGKIALDEFRRQAHVETLRFEERR